MSSFKIWIAKLKLLFWFLYNDDVDDKMGRSEGKNRKITMLV